MAVAETSMALTGVYSGLLLSLNGRSGTFITTADTTARTGYDIATDETSEGVSFNVLTVSADGKVSDPPSIAASLEYAQKVSFDEVDLDLRYTDIPDGTSVQVACSETALSISKQEINGSSLIGSIGKKLGRFEATIDLSLWITEPENLSSSSSLTLSLTSVESEGGGPVKKVLLQKIVLNLAT